jgi:hypothetical protein
MLLSGKRKSFSVNRNTPVGVPKIISVAPKTPVGVPEMTLGLPETIHEEHFRHKHTSYFYPDEAFK